MAFHLGSLGFLTPFQFDNFEEQVTNVLEGHAALTLRSRLRCLIVRRPGSEDKELKPLPPTAASGNAAAAFEQDNICNSAQSKPSTNILVS